MRTNESEVSEKFEQAIEILNAIADRQALTEGVTRDTKMDIRYLSHSHEAFLELLAIAPDAMARATPSILAGFVAGLSKVGYRIVKA